MTLGRIADPTDDTVLVLVRDPAGDVSAFCQFVPSGPGRWSLDVMRRDGRVHPNGLMELALVDFFGWVDRSGGDEVSLNFAPLRLVLEGKASVRPLLGLDRWLLARVGERTQMASLHRFNAKFDPSWRPRYAAVEGAEYLLPASIAWLRAEGIDELPLGVRLLLRARA